MNDETTTLRAAIADALSGALADAHGDKGEALELLAIMLSEAGVASKIAGMAAECRAVGRIEVALAHERANETRLARVLAGGAAKSAEAGR